jgi:D-alanyl-D-alanine carboxypeptidase/D-alanyl-D-alanine-endopeptidase (penicillin-binding protein 4)
LFFLCIFGILHLFAASGHCNEIPWINTLIDNGGYALLKDGTYLYSKNLDTPFIPASTLKLLTSLAALDILGPDHSFCTRLYLDNDQNLYIYGGGDPFFVSEKIAKIAARVRKLGVTEIRDIVLDDSAFALEHVKTSGSAGSTNPYDANNTALGVNFNSLPLQVLRRAKIHSPEPQTPYLPIMGRIGRDLNSGFHRVNVDGFPQIGPLSNNLLYCGQLFRELLSREGIRVKGTIKHLPVPEHASLILTYRAEERVSDLVLSCLLSSNNFMANQLYLAIGASQFGYPATWKKAKNAMDSYIHNYLQLKKQQITVTEGSGLSIDNRISPKAMLVILERFSPHASLIPMKYGVRMKSGTLRESGVYCYAGYINHGTQQSPFVIFLNQKNNGRDKILKQIYRTAIKKVTRKLPLHDTCPSKGETL